MAAPPPAPRSWADLAADHLYEVLARVPCPVDRHRARLACRAWHAAAAAASNPPAKPPPLPRALPWLLLPPAPHPDPDGATRAACCVLSGCRVHHHLAITPPGARCFGSHDGAWLFLHFRDTGSHLLLNVRTGVVHHCLPGVLDNRRVALAAALSSPPREGDASCVAAAVVANVEAPRERSVLVLWRVGAQRLHEAVQSVGVRVSLGCVRVEDIVYHRRAFHLLTRGGDIIVCNPTLLQNGNLGVDQVLRHFLPTARRNDQFFRARYLVVSRGKLLMVVRITPQRPNQPTSEFKVFRVIEPQISGDKAHTDNAEDGGNFAVQYQWSSWSELHTLGGRMLFVGHGCSRSYEVDQYPGFKAGIYFLDDGDFYDAQVIFGDGNFRRYPCSDNGRWSEGHVQRCFPRSDPSDHSAPVWLLP